MSKLNNMPIRVENLIGFVLYKIGFKAYRDLRQSLRAAAPHLYTSRAE